jgi:hypothetical protein
MSPPDASLTSSSAIEPAAVARGISIAIHGFQTLFNSDLWPPL